MQNYIGIMTFDKNNHLGRVNACEHHVSLEPDASQLGDMVKSLAILAAAKGKVEPIIGVIFVGNRLKLMKQLNRVLNFALQ